MVNGHVATSLQDALDYLQAHDAIPYAGGTDLMVEAKEDAHYLFLHKVPEMRGIREDGAYLRFGAAVTFTEIMEHPVTPWLLRTACAQIAAPAIRNLGTIGGNLGNGSAKADSALIFFVTDSVLRLKSRGGERLLPITSFYLGRKKLDLRPGELIVEVLVPKAAAARKPYYKKVGARNALAISRVAFAGLLGVEDGRITHLATAYGAVSDTVFRRPDIDALLVGKTIDEARATRPDFLRAYDEAIVPIRGRISAEYRKDVCMNLLRDFLDENGIA